ncbi:MAG: hypothetical protein C0436_01660 [Alphaproteobacteria bacterium]|nr:hypothetical protein [Alphaproteobacteria bacterium]
MPNTPHSNPTVSVAWLALPPAQRALLLEAARWVHDPSSLAMYDSGPDFPVHPNNMDGAQAMGEFIRRAYSAAGAKHTPARHEARDVLARDKAAGLPVSDTVELFMRAASSEVAKALSLQNQR